MVISFRTVNFDSIKAINFVVINSEFVNFIAINSEVIRIKIIKVIENFNFVTEESFYFVVNFAINSNIKLIKDSTFNSDFNLIKDSTFNSVVRFGNYSKGVSSIG